KQLKIPSHQAAEIIGTWNGPLDELREVTDQVFSFVRPFLENLNWSRLPESGLSLEEVFQKLEVTELKEQLAVMLALVSIPEDNRYRNKEGRNIYQLDATIKGKLEELSLPIQGLKMNPAAAMETVRGFMANHP
ncbi:MBL fold metallo-hydrolase, partial [Alkalihalophilus pseudofirmus]|nr:MBL fold metallo-hydrolase [Alkalihalophilus pseudofirmus]